MTTKTKTNNGQIAAEDAAQNAPQTLAVPEPLAKRIMEKAQAVDNAKTELDELVTLARELAEVSNEAQLRPLPGGGLVWMEPVD